MLKQLPQPPRRDAVLRDEEIVDYPAHYSSRLRAALRPAKTLRPPSVGPCGSRDPRAAYHASSASSRSSGGVSVMHAPSSGRSASIGAWQT